MNSKFYCIEIYNMEDSRRTLSYTGSVYPIKEISDYTIIKVSETKINNLKYKILKRRKDMFMDKNEGIIYTVYSFPNEDAAKLYVELKNR